MNGQAARLGAWPLADGRTRFRLWAPAAASASLVLCGEDQPMRAEGEGLFVVEAEAPAGTPYRFRIDDGAQVPDPASRWQPHGVEGASAVLPEDNHAWLTPDWQGRPWNELVIYEVHVGCSGGFDGLRAQLPALAAMGITALELMPVAQFPGRRNWGYDGVFPYAPAEAYGRPEALKALVDAAHGQGMAVLLDVVYNHFGPMGNLLEQYAPAFFDRSRSTPWGGAIDFGQPEVRRFFIDNALMWLHEYRFDGLRLDAVHAIDSDAFLQQLTDEVHASVSGGRQVHLVLENERNQARWLRGGYQAQWNDDYHNALHVLLTGEHEGYYADYAGPGLAASLLARCLAEGFAWQGQPTPRGVARGEPSADLPPARFVAFAQNHDQVGNRAFGDRLSSLVAPPRARLATALTVLIPMVPLLFMGEPWQARTPFLFFTDFPPPLDDAVREGRRREFAAFSAFGDAAARARIPDPNDPQTFAASAVGLPDANDPHARVTLDWFRGLVALRRRYLQQDLEAAQPLGARVLADRAVQAGWCLPQGEWWVAFNVGDTPVPHALPAGDCVLAEGHSDVRQLGPDSLRVHWVVR
ncbi:malto-oligosyltrehalose trehalohydrolase [Stenotrophomonas sp. 278]|uniref:malto-oligosyltrehalose trehalohydrolase n=1 Tax=Stenotrophomonas sp. 278 TaxID=2479851 RepID=UPI000F68E865|nr:malto-oligosyltrehalose trehalohydrolase [Stenotrophomonas sp. 278]RRU23901.1 malto-oligosyltrehalose trehalohydrolase [Stenotrophomonas sp. 278]